MASAIRILGGDELEDARIAVVAAWLLLGAGVLILGCYSENPNLWYAALAFTLAVPHAATSTATLRAESPAMFFAVLGTMAWLAAVPTPRFTARLLLLGMVGGLFMGLAVTARQYYLCLLPTAALLAVHQWRESIFEEKWRWVLKTSLSLVSAAVPVVFLYLVWHGLSSPGMVSGTSYGVWQSKVGLNLWRPFVAIFYISVYLVPLTYPALVRVPTQHRRRIAVLSALGGMLVALVSPALLQPGPLNSILKAAGRHPLELRMLAGIIGFAVSYNAIAFGRELLAKRKSLPACLPVLFASLVILFFIVEQAGIGGNIPFYELYILQIAPFLALVAFFVLSRLTASRVVVFFCMWVGSQATLWRHAFGS